MRDKRIIKAFAKRSIARVIVCLALLVCVSCSAQRRLSRIVERHPELIELDTISVRGSIVSPGDSAELAIAPEVFATPTSEGHAPLEVAVPGARARLTFDKKGGGKLSIIKDSDTLHFSRDTVLPRIHIERLERSSARDAPFDFRGFGLFIALLFFLHLVKKWLL